MTEATSAAVSADRAQSDEFRTGLLLALAAYGMWGFLPAYYKLTSSVPADLVVSHRILWSVLFVGLFLVAKKRVHEIAEILQQPRMVAQLCASALLIGGNWLVFVWAIENNRVLDVSLGYFVNPLVSILVGLVVLREHLRPLQWLAVGLAGMAVAVQAILAGGLPWVSLFLAVSFAGYAYVRKVTPVRATPGLFVEASLLLPVAVGYLALNASWGIDALSVSDPLLLLALMGTGIVTAFPLVCFSAAARRLPMVMIGLMQYLAPSLHFIMAVFVWGEPLKPATLMTFSVIWIALGVFSFDSWRRFKTVQGTVSRTASP
ncbi:EamA family transporter RarD [Roseibium sp. RKSG952]|uniref:EamA family transporter RarD n=1 Tax=Roseibium sp. RKSG952 TaxID=2529384 RepID=UPI0012BD01EE|nr:EamA family transporter RarD [Roseibium sp. RKSG952]MTI00347.1 EamA family transporter RarD [Roseibium sp. RKSG952]